MYVSANDKQITCSKCGRIIPIGKTEKHVFECVGKKNENRN